MRSSTRSLRCGRIAWWLSTRMTIRLSRKVCTATASPFRCRIASTSLSLPAGLQFDRTCDNSSKVCYDIFWESTGVVGRRCAVGVPTCQSGVCWCCVGLRSCLLLTAGPAEGVNLVQ